MNEQDTPKFGDDGRPLDWSASFIWRALGAPRALKRIRVGLARHFPSDRVFEPEAASASLPSVGRRIPHPKPGPDAQWVRIDAPSPLRPPSRGPWRVRKLRVKRRRGLCVILLPQKPGNSDQGNSSMAKQSSIERKRRYRERQKAGVLLVSVEVDEEFVARLIASGHLRLRDASHRERIAEAIEVIVETEIRRDV